MAGLEGTSFGDFEILEKLGEGGMGAVYKARQGMLDRLTALKVMSGQLGMDEMFVKRFIREAAAAANLSHPNMVQVYKCGEVDGIHYIAMEYVEGESLRKRLDRVGKLDAREAIAVAVCVAQALQYAWNRAHLIHRDIKPDNIFLSKTGEVKVGDLGLAKVVGGESVELTRTGMMVGSPHYISPEQARGLRDLDFRADIYSLGCTLYHMLSGRTPYEGSDAMGVMMRHVNDPPPAIFKVWPQCPVPLALALGRMMAKDRAARHPSYEALLEDLLGVRDKMKSGAGPAPVSPPQPAVPTPPRAMPSLATPAPGTPPPRGKPALPMPALAGAAAAVLALAGLLFWAPWQQAPDDMPRPATAETEAPDPPLNLSADAFAAEVAALPPEEQVARVIAKLKELNPGYDGNETHKIEGGAVVELRFKADVVADLSPVRALSGLRKLRIDTATYGKRSKLSDLSPLRGMQLVQLQCSYSSVTDISPLAGMPLKDLDFWGSPVRDISPLKGLPIEFLRCCKTAIEDLSPLQGMPLYQLECHATPVADLSPLKGLPLKRLTIYKTEVRDLTPLQYLPLEDLRCDFVPQRDAGVLRLIMTLKQINTLPADDFWKLVDAGKVPDPATGRVGAPPDPFIEEIAGLPRAEQVERVAAKLKELNPGFDGKVETGDLDSPDKSRIKFWARGIRDIAPVRALTWLDQFACEAKDRSEKAEFSDLSPLRGLQLRRVSCAWTRVADLSPLRGMPLETVCFFGCPVTDLSPLAESPVARMWISGMPLSSLEALRKCRLTELNINGDPVSDLEPLRGMALRLLNLGNTQVRDLKPIEGMPLEFFCCGGTPVTDLSPLRNAPLKELLCEPAVAAQPANAKILRAIKTIETINRIPPAEFWKQVDAGKVPGAPAGSAANTGAFDENDAEWRNAINLLPLIDPRKDAVEGTWALENDGLSVSERSLARLQIPYQPPEEYDFRIVFTRKSGKGAVWQILAGGGRQFDLCLGGNYGKWFGFESIDGKWAHVNPSRTPMERELEHGRTYTALVQVRRDGLRGFLDGRPITEWRTDYSDMSLPESLVLRDARSLGVGAHSCRVVFHRIEVREVTGKGAFTRGAPDAAAP